MRLARAIVAVMLGTVVAGVVGGLSGLAIGWLAPGFVAWLAHPESRVAELNFDAARFGLGLGAVCGLFLGAMASVLLALMFVLRDMAGARRERS